MPSARLVIIRGTGSEKASSGHGHCSRHHHDHRDHTKASRKSSPSLVGRAGDDPAHI